MIADADEAQEWLGEAAVQPGGGQVASCRHPWAPRPHLQERPGGRVGAGRADRRGGDAERGAVVAPLSGGIVTLPLAVRDLERVVL
jgi:hypothetical protein